MREKLVQSFVGLAESIVTAAPKVVVGIVFIVAGLTAAKLIERVLRFTLTRLRFDQLMQRAGIDRALYRIGLRQQLNVFIPRLVYFLVLFLLAQTAADTLGLAAISGAIAAFFSYLPNIVAALLLLILGTSLGQFAGQMVEESARNSGLDFAPSLGRLVSGLIVFVVSMMAIAQLKIDTEMVRIVTTLVLGGAALAFGLSFGLGTRDVIRNIAAGFYARKFLEVGQPLEISGQQGVLQEINATHVILLSEGRRISIANGTVMDSIGRQ